jgi:hypothetical protein
VAQTGTARAWKARGASAPQEFKSPPRRSLFGILLTASIKVKYSESLFSRNLEMTKPCCPSTDYVNIVQLSLEKMGILLTSLMNRWSNDEHCKGIIMVSYQNDNHVMTHAVRDWKWFGDIGKKYYIDRYSLPIFSIDRALGKYIINNNESFTVDGFIEQEYRQQNNTTHPEVISHNVAVFLES